MPDGGQLAIHVHADPVVERQAASIRVVPLDAGRLDEGGPPGTPRRVMLFAAIRALAGPRVWMHRGRSPEACDWLGFVRACAQVVADNCHDADGPLADLGDYAPGWDDGPDPAAVGALFVAWGLTEKPFDEAMPGDVLVFALPMAHAAVVTRRDAGRGLGVAHACWGRALAETWVDGWWRERAVAAYGWAEAGGHPSP